MQTLIMLTNTDLDIENLRSVMSDRYDPVLLDQTGFIVQRQRTNATVAYVRIWRMSDPASQYRGEREPAPLKIAPWTRGFLIEFNDLALLKEALIYLVGRVGEVVIDDDHGTVQNGKEFVSSLQNSSALTWLPSDYET